MSKPKRFRIRRSVILCESDNEEQRLSKSFKWSARDDSIKIAADTFHKRFGLVYIDRKAATQDEKEFMNQLRNLHYKS